jgi:glycosyltransferase involved in cell wall biosynthesis
VAEATRALAIRARQLGRPLQQLAVGARTRGWDANSRLLVVGDLGGWSVDEDAVHIAAAARRLGYEVAPSAWAGLARGQSVFHTSHFQALTPRWLEGSDRLGLAYMHGRPGTPAMPEFDTAFEALRRRPDRVARVQVTHEEMHELVAAAGVPEERVHRIRLGIDLEHFPLGDEQRRRAARAGLGLPESAFVVGSFQKDGVGWGEGLEPKGIKGPDLLVATLERLHRDAPELVVLLTGPSRGYVKRELEARSILYRHVLAATRDELARAYHALDLYLVTSRQEGGPKAALETAAAGVPLVTTRVGQAQELHEHGRTAALADVEDVDALSGWAGRVREGVGAAWRGPARALAEAHGHERLDPQWAGLLDGFVERP